MDESTKEQNEILNVRLKGGHTHKAKTMPLGVGLSVYSIPTL